jgi:hypothetical protein
MTMLDSLLDEMYSGSTCSIVVSFAGNWITSRTSTSQWDPMFWNSFCSDLQLNGTSSWQCGLYLSTRTAYDDGSCCT